MSASDKAEKGLLHTWSQKVTKYVGSDLRESLAIANDGRKRTMSPNDREPPKGVSRSTTGVVRREIDGSQSTSVEAIKKGSVPEGQLPSWLRKRSASVRHERRLNAQTLADKNKKPLGLEFDAQTKAILASLPKLDPTPTIATDYLKTHANLLRLERTPQDHASSKAHYGKLRTSWRYGEVQAIEDLRKASERARKSNDMETAKALTIQAFERACALDWQGSTESWAAKKASGFKPVRKSKRYGKRAPTPTATAVNFLLSDHSKLWKRHEMLILSASIFGLRPAELKHKDGVELAVQYKNGKVFLLVKIHGAKVDGHRGHTMRVLKREVSTHWQDAGLSQLVDLVEAKGGRMTMFTSEADQRSANRFLNKMQPGLSLYSYRHAVGSDLKASIGDGKVTPIEAAEFMGHRSTQSLDAYGHGRKGKAGKYKARVDGMTSTVEKHTTFKPREVPHFPPRPPQPKHQIRATVSPLAGMKPKPPK